MQVHDLHAFRLHFFQAYGLMNCPQANERGAIRERSTLTPVP